MGLWAPPSTSHFAIGGRSKRPRWEMPSPSGNLSCIPSLTSSHFPIPNSASSGLDFPPIKKSNVPQLSIAKPQPCAKEENDHHATWLKHPRLCKSKVISGNSNSFDPLLLPVSGKEKSQKKAASATLRYPFNTHAIVINQPNGLKYFASNHLHSILSVSHHLSHDGLLPFCGSLLETSGIAPFSFSLDGHSIRSARVGAGPRIRVRRLSLDPSCSSISLSVLSSSEPVYPLSCIILFPHARKIVIRVHTDELHRQRYIQ